MAEVASDMVVTKRTKMTAQEAAATAASAVREAVSEVVTRGGAMLYDHYLDERLVSFAVDRSLQDMMAVYSSRFLYRSEAFGGPAGPEGTPFPPLFAMCDWRLTCLFSAGLTGDWGAWSQETEPESPRTDSWARGAVPLRKRAKPAYGALDAAGVASGAGTRTPRSTAGGSSGRRSREAKNASGASNSSNGSTTPVERPNSAGLAIASGAGTSRPNSPTAAVRAQALAAMKARHEALARKAKREREEEKKQQELRDRLSKELRGKEFTYDADGNVIIVNGVNVSKLPPQYSSVGVAISAEAESLAATPPRRKKQGSKKKRSSKRKKNAKPDVRARTRGA